MRRLEPGEDAGERAPEHHGVQVDAAAAAGAGGAIDAQHALEELGPGGPATGAAWSGSVLLDGASPEPQRARRRRARHEGGRQGLVGAATMPGERVCFPYSRLFSLFNSDIVCFESTTGPPPCWLVSWGGRA